MPAVNNVLSLHRWRSLDPDDSASLSDLASIARMDRSGVVVTAPGDGRYDCVSRYFAPAKGIPEDPVTGGAHCALTPYWAQRLGKTELRAYQASPRGGDHCVFYLEGEAEIDFSGSNV